LLSLVCAADRRYLLSFPTRRSSDLLSTVPGLAATWGKGITVDAGRWIAYWARASIEGTPGSLPWTEVGNRELEVVVSKPRVYGRSEEHTSELQSRENLVCRLLLEKK